MIWDVAITGLVLKGHPSCHSNRGRAAICASRGWSTRAALDLSYRRRGDRLRPIHFTAARNRLFLSRFIYIPITITLVFARFCSFVRSLSPIPPHHPPVLPRL
jgi:hypothetical protein